MNKTIEEVGARAILLWFAFWMAVICLLLSMPAKVPHEAVETARFCFNPETGLYGLCKDIFVEVEV